MRKELMLVGSVPLETAEEVFEKMGTTLGPYLRTLPDGEVGDRQYWVVRMQFQVFNGHPDLQTVKRPAPDDGVERLVPRDAKDGWFFRVRDGVDSVRFGNPGWRLGYARDAIQSYAVFRMMKERGVVPPSVRFQVSLPLANSAVSPRVFGLEDLPRVRPGFTAALKAEAAKIIEWIPNEDLAIQWDASWELTDAYGAVPGLDPRDALERNVAQVRTLVPDIPEKVAVGYHLCFGTFGGWPRVVPDDLGQAVKLANAFVAESGRRVDWLHIPALDTVEEAFYRPLSGLAPRGARVYLGLIHNMGSYKARLAVARKFLPEFGVAAYCGFGRLPPTELPKILRDHLDAVSAL